ncbi:MAG TPA: ThiF family adenylyltransferase [Lacisediminihabitans sp.]|nr:ThiF family adenylyltransferase [Lacisediminihabitans sp.]HXD60966.1 ThiF family adenylyltransferase [Lacisediminihabitans sp.]
MNALPSAARLPPLVEPGPPLDSDRLARYSRQLAMPGFDDTAQRRLAAARVLVVGAGGLGSASIPYLASAGIGTIGVIDTDVVELSNLHRQVSHGMSDLGRDKVDSIADTVHDIDPQTVVRQHRVWLDSSNALELFAEYDLVLDGSDNFATRYLVNDAAALTHKPVVWGAILRYGGQSGVVFSGHGPSYRDLFPKPPEPGDVLSCSVGGVLPTVCAIIGSIMANEAIKLVTGIGEPLLGRVTTFDALSGRFREIPYRAIPDAEPITELIDYELFCGRAEQVPQRAERVSQRAESTTPAELAGLLAGGEILQLIDVREPFEAQIAKIGDAELIPLGTVAASLDRVSRDLPVVLYCHHDTRSRYAAGILRENGFTDVRWLEGGIDAYAAAVDHSLARY